MKLDNTISHSLWAVVRKLGITIFMVSIASHTEIQLNQKQSPVKNLETADWVTPTWLHDC